MAGQLDSSHLRSWKVLSLFHRFPGFPPVKFLVVPVLMPPGVINAVVPGPTVLLGTATDTAKMTVKAAYLVLNSNIVVQGTPKLNLVELSDR